MDVNSISKLKKNYWRQTTLTPPPWIPESQVLICVINSYFVVWSVFRLQSERRFYEKLGLAGRERRVHHREGLRGRLPSVPGPGHPLPRSVLRQRILARSVQVCLPFTNDGMRVKAFSVNAYIHLVPFTVIFWRNTRRAGHQTQTYCATSTSNSAISTTTPSTLWVCHDYTHTHRPMIYIHKMPNFHIVKLKMFCCWWCRCWCHGNRPLCQDVTGRWRGFPAEAHSSLRQAVQRSVWDQNSWAFHPSSIQFFLASVKIRVLDLLSVGKMSPPSSPWQRWGCAKEQISSKTKPSSSVRSRRTPCGRPYFRSLGSPRTSSKRWQRKQAFTTCWRRKRWAEGADKYTDND